MLAYPGQNFLSINYIMTFIDPMQPHAIRNQPSTLVCELFDRKPVMPFQVILIA